MPQFLIAEVKMSEITVGFFEGKIGLQQMSVIGGDMIKRFNIIIDANRVFIYLIPNNFMSMPFSQI